MVCPTILYEHDMTMTSFTTDIAYNLDLDLTMKKGFNIHQKAPRDYLNFYETFISFSFIQSRIIYTVSPPFHPYDKA